MVDNESLILTKKISNRRKSFHFRYMELCRAKNFSPLPEVKAKNNMTSVLDFYGDKFRLDDWFLIIEALQYDQSLQHIGIRLRKTVGNILDNLDTEKKARQLKNKPMIYTKFIISKLMDAVTKAVTCNRNLTTLILEAVPLQEIYVTSLAKALSFNESLKSVSFSRSLIGDKGCEAICSTIKYLLHIEDFNMSQCQLTSLGANAVADMIKFQKIYRYSEGWKKSLRYRDVNPDTIPGLRTIIIGNNPELGDKGAELIAEILKEDVWIKEIDMSDCGLTDIGGKYILDCLEINKYIVEFKTKGNREISPAIQRSIHMQLGQEEGREGNAEGSEKKSKMNSQKIREKLKLLEEQIISEKNLRKQVEILNERLHSQIMCYEEKLAEQKELEIPEGFTLVEKEHLEQLVQERECYKTALSLMKVKEKRPKKSIKKAKSEIKYVENLRERDRISRSEHCGININQPQYKPPNSVYVEKNIGDASFNHPNIVIAHNVEGVSQCNITKKVPAQSTQQYDPQENQDRSSTSSGSNKTETASFYERPIRENTFVQVNVNKSFKGIDEALRLFGNKKQQNSQCSSRQLASVRNMFMGGDNNSAS